MSELIIYRASAGAGKTWQLTYEYLRLVFSRPEDYRHILAVTFTNKATEEMRSRILEELRKMVRGENSDVALRLIEEGIVKPEAIQTKALHILRILLHNFSRFTVTTIDSFFHRILKSFAREAGVPFYRELILDDKVILEETIDQLFFHLDEHPFLQEWLISFTLEMIRNGKSWNVRKEVSQLGKEILKEAYPYALFSQQTKYSDADRKNWQAYLFGEEKRLEKELAEKGSRACEIAGKFGLTTNDFPGKSRSVLAYFENLAGNTTKDPSPTIQSALHDESKWFTKTSGKKEIIQQAMQEGMLPLLAECINLSQKLQSIQILKQNFFVWAILSDLADLLNLYLNDHNLHLLSDTHKILYHLIGNNDAPFIFEKAGNTWLHFMIDEFQDTSALQWNNFKPLIANSLGEGKTSLVVGDVKQSIYRWRNSDWRILAWQVARDFPDRNRIVQLPMNRRSCRYVTEFNNEFFLRASEYLRDMYCSKTGLPEEEPPAKYNTEAYRDCHQHVPEEKKQTTGFIRIEIHHATGEESPARQRFIQTVLDLLACGYRPEDIAVLVRTKDEAENAASWLMNTENYPPGTVPPGIITEEAILLSKSPVIRVLCCLLRYLINPDDQLNNLYLLNELLSYLQKPLPEGTTFPPPAFDRKTTERYLPQEFLSQIDELKKLPLQILGGRLVSLFGLDHEKEQIPYLFSFMDQMNTAIQKGIADLYGFLEYWDKKSDELSLTIPDKTNAIRIMTIHKAKGLEFPVVILPSPAWSMDHRPNQAPFLWVKKQIVPGQEPVFYPVRYGNSLSNTDFSAVWSTEKMQTYVDNLNLLYVAFTRAREGLIVIGNQSKDPDATNVIQGVCNQLPDTFLQKQETEETTLFTKGSFPERIERNHKTEESWPTHKGERLFTIRFPLLIKKNSPEYFTEAGEPVHTVRDDGKLMHALLSGIRYAKDVELAVRKSVLEGKISRQEVQVFENRIAAIVNDPEMAVYFTDAWKIYTENDLLLPGGETRRPDRILINQNETVVIDYKFGETAIPSHTKQVRDYLQLLSEAGFPSPRGIVWYLLLNRKEYITL